jgi:hypothetical protein
MIPLLLIQAMAAAKLAIDLIDHNIDGLVQVVRLLPDDDVGSGDLQPDLGPEFATVVAAAGVDEFDEHADDPRVVTQQSFDLARTVSFRASVRSRWTPVTTIGALVMCVVFLGVT